jgi:hypothetical protein
MPTSEKISQAWVPLITNAATKTGTIAIDAIEAFFEIFIISNQVRAAPTRRKG